MRVQTVVSTPRLSLTNLPMALQEHVEKMARQDGLELSNAGRSTVLLEVVDELETYLGRLVVPVARMVVTEVAFDQRPTEPVSIVPRYPDVSGCALADVAVRRWNVDDYEAVTVERRPGGRVVLEDAGDYELTVEVTPASDMPHQFVEAVGRVYSFRTTKRPGRRRRRPDAEPVGGRDSERRRRGPVRHPARDVAESAARARPACRATRRQAGGGRFPCLPPRPRPLLSEPARRGGLNNPRRPVR